MVEHTRLAGPPDQRANRRQRHFNVHAGGADRGPMPFVGQHPGIRHVTVQARRQHQHEDADFMAFAAEVFASEAMAEFVQDFCNR